MEVYFKLKRILKLKKKLENGRLVNIISLGCPKNFVDTEIAAGSLLCRGLGITGDPEEADIMLINTCAFIDTARKESIEVIRKAAAWKKRVPGRKLAVAGCLVEWNGAGSVREKFPEVDLWTRIDSVERMGELLADMDGAEKLQSEKNPCYIYDDRTARLQLTPSHYAYLKIADGCDNRCAYCSIPNIRGNLRSRTETSVVREARNLLENGVRELIVIAQDTTAFRRDKGEKNALAKLIRKLDRFDGNYLIRLMYLHPASITDELAKTLADTEHLARCVEMPIQHISDHILLSMGRRAGEVATREAVRKIRETAKCALRTTFMVGFPGETEEDFRKLEDFVREQKFARLGAFCYSPEIGTPAAEFPKRVPRKLAQTRYERIMEIQNAISLEANKSLKGREMKFLVDSVKGSRGIGRTELDAPGIDNGAILKKCPKGLEAGSFIRAKVTDAKAYDISAEYIGKA